jgi:hypothetical protein
LTGVASVVKSMDENGVDARIIERVLCALRECPEHELADVVGAVQSMVEDGMEAEDIEKSARAPRVCRIGLIGTIRRLLRALHLPLGLQTNVNSATTSSAWSAPRRDGSGRPHEVPNRP